MAPNANMFAEDMSPGHATVDILKGGSYRCCHAESNMLLTHEHGDTTCCRMALDMRLYVTRFTRRQTETYAIFLR